MGQRRQKDQTRFLIQIQSPHLLLMVPQHLKGLYVQRYDPFLSRLSRSRNEIIGLQSIYLERLVDQKFSFFDQDYEAACDKLKAETNRTSTICYEDVLMQILRDGKKLSIIDLENGGDYSVSIDLNDVHERVALTPLRHLMDSINENGDAVTADCILQSVFFKEVVFG